MHPAHDGPPKPPAHLGERIRQRRILVGIKQAELGQLVGVHRATIGGIESGKVRGDTTMAALLTLGCIRQLDPNGELVAVVSATATRIATTAIIAASTDEPERLDNLATCWRDLVLSITQSGGATPPPGYQGIHHVVAAYSTSTNTKTFEEEMERRASDADRPSLADEVASLKERMARLDQSGRPISPATQPRPHPLSPRMVELADLYYELNPDDRKALDDALNVVHRYALTMLMRAQTDYGPALARLGVDSLTQLAARLRPETNPGTPHR